MHAARGQSTSSSDTAAVQSQDRTQLTGHALGEARPTSHAQHSPDARPWRAALLAVVVFGLSTAIAVSTDYDPRDRLVVVTLQAGLAVCVAALAMLWHRGGRWANRAAELAVAVASAFPALVLTVALHGSVYPVGGIGIAQANRTPAVARYMDVWQLADYTYQGLPAFYPPLMPWIVGRLALVLNLEAYHALKLANIGMLFLAPLLAYVLWRRVVRPPVAVFVPVAIVALLSVQPSMLQQPDALLSLLLIIPWWLEAIYGMRREGVRRWPPWVYGVLGAVIFCLYFYFFFPLALSLLFLPLLHRWHGQSVSWGYRRPLTVLAVAAALSSVYWAPLGVSMLRAAEPESLQNLWFTAAHAALRVGLFNATPVHILSLVGLVYLAFSAREDRLSAGLLLLLGAGYGWYIIAFMLAAARRPVLAFRVEPFLKLLLLIAAVHALAALFAFAKNWQRRSAPAAEGVRVEVNRFNDVARVTAVVGAALTFTLAQAFTLDALTYRRVRESHNTPLPSGRLQAYADSNAERPAVSADRLEHVVRELHGRTSEQPVVLSVNVPILKLSGVYGFNQWSAIYAHPAGEFHARVRFLRALADETGPGRFATMARENRFDPIDVVVLERRGDHLLYRASDIEFPEGRTPIRVRYRLSQFSPRHWRIRHVGPYFIASAR